MNHHRSAGAGGAQYTHESKPVELSASKPGEGQGPGMGEMGAHMVEGGDEGNRCTHGRKRVGGMGAHMVERGDGGNGCTFTHGRER